MSPKNKPDSPSQNCTLGEAATKFLISFPSENRLQVQQEVNKFVRWYGEKRLFSELTALEVSTYAEQTHVSTTDSAEKLEPIKEFLSYAFKQSFTSIKLASQIKFKKTTSSTQQSAKRKTEQTINLTAEGFSELEAELTALKNERPKATEEIRRAAADKDFRENAPLEAAREYQSHLEGRIRELESALKKATIIIDKPNTDHKASLGDIIVLQDLTAKTQTSYTLVDAREANPIKGKLSIVSPIGKAILGHIKGDTIHVIAPAGTLPYRIEDIKQQ
jgi:transcription elongation factor GreA